jgi:hypothetical protein
MFDGGQPRLDRSSDVDPETPPGLIETPARSSVAPYLTVLLGGAISSLLTLAGVFWLDRNATDFHIMGWYANYVIPAGAVIVGLAAGSGYGIASYLIGVRISRGLLWTVVLMQTGAYVAAEYVEYRDLLERIEQKAMVQRQDLPSFLEYYDFKARNFAWKEQNAKVAGKPLGGWGYVFVLLGAGGFILGGIIAPAILFAAPYCDGCQRYMARKVLGVLPASVAVKKISKKDTDAQQAYAKEHEEAAARAELAVGRLREAIANRNDKAFASELSSAGSVKQNNKLPRRIDVSLVWCKRCDGGRIVLTLVSGTGERKTQVKMEETTVLAEFIRTILAVN